MCIYTERDYYKELAHAVIESGESKSVVLAGKPETHDSQWCSLSLKERRQKPRRANSADET